MNSNASRPVPPANTGSAFLDWVADASIAITHFERALAISPDYAEAREHLQRVQRARGR